MKEKKKNNDLTTMEISTPIATTTTTTETAMETRKRFKNPNPNTNTNVCDRRESIRRNPLRHQRQAFGSPYLDLLSGGNLILRPVQL